MPFVSSVRGSYGSQGKRRVQTGRLGIGATGGTTVIAGGYRYHTFTATGASTFVPDDAGSIEMLMVAGGGGGGASGAGAGGLLYVSSAAVIAENIPVVVGAGGIGRATAWGGDGLPVSHGEDTTVTILGTTRTARKGQGARGWDVQADTTLNIWGSGSGGPQSSSTPYTGGGYTPGQGFPGGDDQAANSPPYPSGGGGGAGAKGGDTNGSTSTISGAGGAGLQYSSFATATSTGANGGYYAGGGAGCNHTTPNPATSGGIGGGGSHPGGQGTPSAGVNGTGGGGAGGTNAAPTSAGGTGIVIIRYPI